ncbi:hypothetical protein ETAE_1961 [Edwardsiella piscicida]|uniref:Uncharacterized protein n=1 Tax=Edwardsiella piscicida TaxID=1263550 RepID=A0AAU8P3J0_EDWPI|nr:hypothetical protein ETAE_1961 [Edwardsiella tarda EIB202]
MLQSYIYIVIVDILLGLVNVNAEMSVFSAALRQVISPAPVQSQRSSVGVGASTGQGH